MVTRLYIVRHCQSTGNIAGRFQGRFDAPVSPQGEQQLELLSLRFRNEAIDAVYSSPLTRAYRTAEAINRFHGLPIRVEEGLSEIDVGQLESLLLGEIAVKYPETARAWDETPEACQFPGGESMGQVYERVNGCIDRIIAENQGRTVAVATHGGAIRCLYTRVASGSLAGLRESSVFGNTGVSVLEEENGVLTWAMVNDLSHLPEELSRPPVRFHLGEAAPV